MLFVGEALVELELVKDAAVESWVKESVVLVALLVLLPLEVYERTCRVLLLGPDAPCPQHSPHEFLVIALAHIELAI